MDDRAAMQQRMQNAYPKLSKGKQKATQFIMSNLDEVAFMTTSALARKIDVSESLIVRLAKDLGFRGYPDFQEACRTLVLGQLGKADLFERGVRVTGGDPASVVIRRDLHNIRNTMRHNPGPVLEQAVDLLQKAKRVRILAGRTSIGPGLILSIYLNELLNDVDIVTPSYGNMFDVLRRLGPEDVAVPISFSHYTRTTIEAARFVKERGCKILAITDLVGSPLQPIADVCLHAEVGGVSFNIAHTAAISLVNVLIHMVGLRNKDTVASLLREVDRLTHNRLYYERRPDREPSSSGTFDSSSPAGTAASGGLGGSGGLSSSIYGGNKST